MAYFNDYKVAAQADRCFHEALVLAKTFKGSSKEFDDILKEKFGFCAVVREELLLVMHTRREFIKILNQQ